MKNKSLLIKRIILFSIILTLNYPLFSQLSIEDTPFGLAEEFRAKISDPVWIEMEQIDVNALIEEDRTLDTITGIPYRFGENLSVDLNPKNSGVWDILDDGSKIWRLGIISRGAVSINLTFNHYRLPEGARLFVYTPDGKHVIGAFSELNNQEDGYFATTLITGDQIIIEYYEPARVDSPGELNLWRVTHGYRGPGAMMLRGFGDSDTCHVNVVCPEGYCWDFHSRSVALMVDGGVSASGFLINNTRNNGTPYFLSAWHNHAIGGMEASTAFFIFNYQSPTCQPHTPAIPPDGYAMSGAVTRALQQSSDFWLLELNQQIPNIYNVYYAGWNRTNAQVMEGIFKGIHHPQGDIKKINWTDGITRANDSVGHFTGTPYWRINEYIRGAVELGSSGSPLFDPNGYAIGILSHGEQGCAAKGPAWYGRIGAAWTGGGTNSTRLRNWLDPDNTGVMTWHGYDPNMQLAISGPSLVCNSNKTYTLATLPSGLEVSWAFSPAHLVNSPSGNGTSAILRMANSSSSGKGAITFTVTRPGCENIITKLSKEIWVGPPSYDYISGPQYTPNNQWAFYSAEPDNHLMEAQYIHTWVLNPLNGYVLYPAGKTVDIAFYNSGDYQLMVRGQNECGTGPNRVTGIHVYDARSLTITPNPATNEAIITIGSPSTEKTPDETIEWDLEVYNSQQMLMSKATRIRGNQYRLQTTGWRTGTYIVRVIYGKEILNEKLLIVGY